MLKIEKSHFDGSYIVYDDKDFDHHHTHTKYLQIALVIRDNVSKLRIPKSRNAKMIESHIRVATDPEYIQKLKDILFEIEYDKKLKAINTERDRYYGHKNNPKTEVSKHGSANRHK